jgi:hypothetical protein
MYDKNLRKRIRNDKVIGKNKGIKWRIKWSNEKACKKNWWNDILNEIRTYSKRIMAEKILINRFWIKY